MMPFIRLRGKAAKAGTASIEFAILAPVFVLMVAGGVDYGIFMAQESWLVAATRVGSEYAARINPGCITVTAQGPKLCEAATTFVDDYTPYPGIPVVVPNGSPQVCTCANGDPSIVANRITPCPPTGVNPCNVGGDTRVFVYQTVTSAVGRYRPVVTFGWDLGHTFMTSSTMRSQ